MLNALLWAETNGSEFLSSSLKRPKTPLKQECNREMFCSSYYKCLQMAAFRYTHVTRIPFLFLKGIRMETKPQEVLTKPGINIFMKSTCCTHIQAINY